MTTPANFRETDHPRDRLGRFILKNAFVSLLGGGSGQVIGRAPHGRIDVLRSDGVTVRVSPGHITVTDEPRAAGRPQADRAPARSSLKPEKTAGPGESVDLFSLGPRDVPEKPDVGNQTAAGQQAVQNVLDADEDLDDDDAEITDEDWRRPPTVFEFPAYRLADAVNKIDIANRRAERAGIAERFGYSIERYEVTRTTDKDGNLLAFPYIEERVRLTLDRPTVQHDGWTFVATLSWDPEAGLVTRVVPDAILGKRPEARHCDVCNSQRDRKDTYVIQNAEGEEKQVGSNCLHQFMGLRPASLWMLDYSPDMPGEDESEGGYGGSREESRYDTTGLLRLALAMVSKRGWVSRSAASTDSRKAATADLMFAFMSGQFAKSRDPGEQQFHRELVDLIDEESGPYGEEAVAVRDFARTIEGDSEYVINLRAVAGADSVSSRNLALLASAVAAKQRHDGYVAERKAKEAATGASKHVGKVGDKVADVPVKITGIKMIDGDYGVSTLLTFIDGEGNVWKWFASGVKDEFEIGDDVLVSGTIKKHGEFRGVPETNLTRAKLKATGDRGAAEAAEEARIKAEAAAAKKAAKVAVPEGYAAYGGEPLEVGQIVRIVDESARTKVKPYRDVRLSQAASRPGEPQAFYARYVGGGSDGWAMPGVLRPEDVVAVRKTETKGLRQVKTTPGPYDANGEHIDYTAQSAPGSQTAVPPGRARLAMASPTEEYEIAIVDERWKREGGHDESFKGLEPINPDADLLDEDEDYVPDASLFDGEPEADPEPEGKSAPVERGSYVGWDGGSGRVDMVILAGRLPGVKDSPVATKSAPLARVVLRSGVKVPVPLAALVPLDVEPEPEVKDGYAALNALVQRKAAPLGLSATAVSQAYGRGLKGWPGEDVTTLTQQEWALGRAEALVSAAAGVPPYGFADVDLLP